MPRCWLTASPLIKTHAWITADGREASSTRSAERRPGPGDFFQKTALDCFTLFFPPAWSWIFPSAVRSSSLKSKMSPFASPVPMSTQALLTKLQQLPSEVSQGEKFALMQIYCGQEAKHTGCFGGFIQDVRKSLQYSLSQNGNISSFSFGMDNIWIFLTLFYIIRPTDKSCMDVALPSISVSQSTLQVKLSVKLQNGYMVF